MPNLGDTKSGKELGRKAKKSSFIWWECPNCKRQYWKTKSDLKRSATNGLCIHCCSKLREEKGDASPNWRGGRHKYGNGYISIYLTSTDPFYLMGAVGTSHCGRYIAEHRLVMAKHLGRCLTSKEIVHHLNGVRDDNRIVNLALTTTKAHPSKTFIRQLQKRIRGLEQLHLNFQGGV